MSILGWSSARKTFNFIVGIILLLSSNGVQSESDLVTGSLRLVNGSQNSGRLEIYYEGEWGTICNDGWRNNEADVACRGLGLGKGEVVQASAGSGEIFLAQVVCNGTENSIINCVHNNFGGHNCTHDADVGVQCEDLNPSADYNTNMINDCDFRLGTCGYMTSSTSSYRWNRIRGSTPSIGTGPSFDHTDGSTNGYYMYTEASSGVRGSVARLYTSTSSRYIKNLEFWYHMYGSTIGTLNVKLLQGSVEKTVWSRQGEQGNYWHRACITVDSMVQRLTFEGIRGSSFTGDIAIDDILFHSGGCSELKNANCTFEKGTCGYETIRGNGSSVVWGPVSGTYPSPIYDHTTNKSYGRYMALYPRSAQEGMKSYILSQPLMVDRKMKVEFYYYMNGNGPGELQVSLRGKSAPLNTWNKNDWQDNGNHGNRWNYGCMDLHPTVGEYGNMTYKRILFTGITGLYSGIKLGIDDITVTNGSCKDGIDTHLCTFNNEKLCDYSVNCTALREYTWRRMIGSTTSRNTGPTSDASRNRNGYYLYAEGSYGHTGDAVSASFPVEDTAGMYLKFNYHMYGVGMGSLILEYSDGQWHQEITRFTGNQGNMWKSFCQRINRDIDTVKLIAVRGHSYTSDIAVDNIFLDKNACPNPVNCDFEDGMCNYTMASSSDYGYRWNRYKTNDHTYGTGFAARTMARYSTEGMMASFRTTDMFQNQNKSSLHFFYRTSLNFRGKFMVGVDKPSMSIAVGMSEWKSFSNPYPDWVMGCVDLPENGMASVNFTAYSSYTTSDYIMIDDIAYNWNPCEYGILDRTCTFDEPNICAYNVSCRDTSDYLWRRGQRTTPTRSTGPISDHTPYGKGYMMYTESTYGAPEDETSLVFPEFVAPPGHYLSFYYNMHGRDIGTLEVYVHTSAGKRMMWMERGETGTYWLKGCVNLPANELVRVAFNGIRGNGPLGDISIDDVGLESGICHPQSIDCNFDDEMICGYRNGTNYGKNGWYRRRSSSGYSMFTTSNSGRHKMRSPIRNLTDSCVQVSYRINGRYCSLDVFTTHNNKKVLSLGSINGTSIQTAQFYVQEGETALLFDAMTTSSWNSFCSIQIEKVEIKNGACPPLACHQNSTACNDQTHCIPDNLLCNRIDNCLDGSDEKMNCPRSISCDFEDTYLCGYNFSFGWYHTRMMDFKHLGLSLNDSVYSMTLNYGNASIYSPREVVNNKKCVQFHYAAGSGSALEVEAVYNDGSSYVKWATGISVNTPWTLGQFEMSPGDVFLNFTGQTKTLGLALDNVELSDGDCQTLVCNPGFFRCPSNEKCISEKDRCNRKNDCQDESDESNCPTSITCDAEDPYHCGYEYDEGSWKVTSGIDNPLPSLDASRGLYSGHYFASDWWQNTGNPHVLHAPQEWLPGPACVSFYYSFFGTGELEVFDNGVSVMDIWPNNIDTWQRTQFQLNKGLHNISWMHKNVHYYKTANPEVLALDSIELSNGTCKNLVCEEGWIKCKSTNVCIPEFKVCDHDKDCPNREDEQNCQSYSNLRFAEGRNVQQGFVEVYYKSNWTRVCGSWYHQNAAVACREMGYNGTARTTFRTQQSNYTQTTISSIYCRGYESSLDQCSIRSCNTYCACTLRAAVDCSDNYCESTDVPCESSISSGNSTNSTKCIPKDSVCDGEKDCPGGTDERNCPVCPANTFQCINYDCIPISQRCDGTMQCDDGSDEYRCFKHDVYSMSFMVGDKYMPICEKNVNDQDTASKLCKYAGKGDAGIVDSMTVGQGVLFKYSSDTENSVLPGFKPTLSPACQRLALKCIDKECGTRSPNLVDFVMRYGHEALPGEFPWQVSLHYNSRLSCGGVIISPRYVLTAAHCVPYSSYPSRYKLYAGSVLYNGGKEYRIRKIIRHSNYSQSQYRFDFALLETRDPITMTDYVRAACLPTEPCKRYTKGFGTGWGDDENRDDPPKLQQARLTLLPTEICQRNFPNMHPSSFCANHQYPNQPGCYGDSGGPFVARNDHGYWEVCGLFSYGKISCAGPDSSPQVFSDVFEAKDWIKSNMVL